MRRYGVLLAVALLAVAGYGAGGHVCAQDRYLPRD